jgi:hypothetical protein
MKEIYLYVELRGSCAASLVGDKDFRKILHSEGRVIELNGEIEPLQGNRLPS